MGQEDEKWWRPLLSRKFIVAVLSLVSVTALTAFKIIDGSLYGTVMIATAGAYMTANVTQKHVVK